MTDQSIEQIAREKQNRPDGCVSAALAALLGVPLSAVPRFDEEANPGKNQNAIVRSWLATQGLGMAVTGNPGRLDHPCRYIASGPAARGEHHACVYDRGELEFDPHESNAGLIEVDQCWLIYPLGKGLPGLLEGERRGMEKAESIVHMLGGEAGSAMHEDACSFASQAAAAIRSAMP